MKVQANAKMVTITLCLLSLQLILVTSLTQDICDETAKYISPFGDFTKVSVLPFARNPSNHALRSLEPLSRCYLTTISSPSLNRAFSSSSISRHDETLVCSSGCVRMLYRIKTGRKPTFYVLIIFNVFNLRYGSRSSSCPNRFRNRKGRETALHRIFSSRNDLHRRKSPQEKNVLAENNIPPLHIGRMQRFVYNDKCETRCNIGSSNEVVQEQHSMESSQGEQKKKNFNCVPRERLSNHKFYVHRKHRFGTLSSSPYGGNRHHRSACFTNSVELSRDKENQPASFCTHVYNTLMHQHHIGRKGERSSSNNIIQVKSLFFSCSLCSLSPADFEICYVPSFGQNVHPVALDQVDIVCQFGCRKQYFRYQPTGEIALFIFESNCILQSAFQPCSSVQISKRYLWEQNPLSLPTKVPIPAVFQVTDPENDRKRAVRRAVRRLRKRVGFRTMKTSSIVESKVVRKGKFVFQVILWFDLLRLEFGN